MRAVLAGAIVFAAVISFLLSFSEAAYCHGKPRPDAKPNMLPVYNKAPVFVKSVKNGKLFTLNEGDDQMYVLHVYGTPYEMGFAHGSLVKEQLSKFMGELWNYILVQIEKSITFLPEWLQKIVAEKGVDFALDITYDLTRMFTGSYIYEEMKGIADATGVDYKLLRRVHLIGELTKGACSMMGAWGDATPFAKTLQLRAFDWDTDGPYKNYPAMIVYHPKEGNGHTFVNIGFLGWIGSFSGMSSQQMAISEIGVSFPDDTFGKESRIGIPFTYILRDMLQFDKTLDESIHRIQSANRTCNLILGVGDAKAGTFRAFQYSHTVATVISDQNLLPANDTWHPKIKDVVYFGMDWLCPNYHQVMAQNIKDQYGNITAETTMRYIVPLTSTGNLQVAIYDLSNNQLFISYARKDGVKSDLVYAYERTFSQVDTVKLFAEPAPTAQELESRQ